MPGTIVVVKKSRNMTRWLVAISVVLAPQLVVVLMWSLSRRAPFQFLNGYEPVYQRVDSIRGITKEVIVYSFPADSDGFGKTVETELLSKGYSIGALPTKRNYRQQYAKVAPLKHILLTLENGKQAGITSDGEGVEFGSKQDSVAITIMRIHHRFSLKRYLKSSWIQLQSNIHRPAISRK